MLEPRLIKMFLVLAEELHFGIAAKRLFISQPPLSQAMKRLEEKVGAKLFNTTTRSVELTSAGQYLYTYLKSLEQGFENVKLHLKNLAEGKEGIVRLGVTPSGMYSGVSELLRRFKQEYPNITLNLQESDTDKMRDMLVRNQLDIAIMRPVTRATDFQQKIFFEDPLCLAVYPEHELASKDIVSKEDLEGPIFIAYDTVRSPYLHKLTTKWYSKNDLRIQTIQSSALPELVTLIAGQKGIALVPSVFAQFNMFGLKYINLSNSADLISRLNIVWRTNESNQTVLNAVELISKNRPINTR